MCRHSSILMAILLVYTMNVFSYNRDSLFSEAKTLSRKGDFEGALNLLDTLLNYNTKDYDAMVQKAFVYRWRGNQKEASLLFSEIIVHVPEYTDAWYGMIDCVHDLHEPQKCCSLITDALIRFPNDSILVKKQRERCMAKTEKKVTDKEKVGKGLLLSGGVRVSAFEHSYRRSPWLEGQVCLSRGYGEIRPGIGIRAQRRVYEEEVYTAAELEMATEWNATEYLALTLRSSASPYTLADSIYPSFAVSGELNVGLPWSSEIDFAARMRMYGEITAYLYSAGCGIYLGRYLLYPHVYIASVDRNLYFSGSGEIRRYSLHDENAYFGIFFSTGRSPYDGGSVSAEGYFNMMEGGVKARLSAGERITLLPVGAIGAEQTVKITADQFDQNEQKSVSEVRMRVSFMLHVEVNG